MTLQMQNQHREATAYVVQLARATFQVAFDQGSWESASIFLQERALLERIRCIESTAKLETFASHKRALEELQESQLGGGGDGSGSGSGKGDGKKKKDDDTAGQ